jgi:hypothetical protein
VLAKAVIPNIFKAGLLTIVLLAVPNGSTIRAQTNPVKNIVLVHGA